MEKPPILHSLLKPILTLIIRTLTLLLAGMFALQSCNTTTVQYDIPEPFVDETVYLSDPSSFNLTVIGGQLLLPNAGHAGVLVYRRYYDQEFYDFAAYEAACPTHWADGCGTLSTSNGDLYFTCGCDAHQYQLLDGQSTDTSHVLPIKEYRCQYDGVNIIRISN
ncbi:MAG: Uncharacterised protein [Cryomorphaceae bacterium]|nr:MAG: Uncharacterised protein [Cryomorphaceae bacterium]